MIWWRAFLFATIGALILLLCLALTALAGESSVLDFGALPNDGSDDSAAFQAAVDAGGVIRVPAGTYNLQVSGKNWAVYCRKSVDLVGDGRKLSVIQTEDSLTAPGNPFGCAPGTRVTFRGLTIQGPTRLNGHFSTQILHYGGPDGLLRIEDCEIRGGHMAIRMEESAGARDEPRTVIMDCVIGPVARTGFLQAGGGSADMIRTRFQGYGLAGSNQAHAVYTYSAVDLLVDRCTFDGNRGRGYEVHPYGDTFGTGGRIVIRGSRFRPSASGQGILGHTANLTLISECRLGPTGVWVRKGDVTLSDCALQTESQVKPWPYTPGHGVWTFRDCRFGVE